ncbi:MAG TPA: FtsX-like permease family protein [Solirubrobacteraceae bacterium]|nr:FtsX-like permease family protein [Solirubrobacteraceae bacterium]
MLRLAFKGLAARPLRTALTAFAVVLGVAMVSAAFTITDTMRGAADSLSRAAYDGTDGVVVARTAFKVDASDWTARRPTVGASLLERVRAVPGVAVAAADITDEAKIIKRDGKPAGDGPYFGVGFDARTPGTERLTPFRLDAGRWATGPGEVVLDAATAEDQRYGIGSTVRITTRGHARPFEVVGVARFGAVKSLGVATAAVFDLRTAQQLFERGTRVDGILVAGRDGVPAAELRAAVAAAVPRASVVTAQAQDRFTLDGLEQFISIIRIVLLVFGGVAILVGAFTIFNTLSITVAQRTRELGLLRMVGAERRQVLGSVLGEALLLGAGASLVGLVAGLGLAKGLDAIFDSMQIALPDAGTVFATRTIVVSLVVGTVVTLAAGLIPAWRATRVAPVAALRGATPGAGRVRLPARAVRGLASVLGRPGQAIGGVAGGLARRNAMRQPGRTLATATALTIGVALVTVVTVIAAGLKDTTRGTLEDRVAATHVITGADGWSPTDPAVGRAIADAGGRVTGIRQDRGLAFGQKETVNAIEPATVGGIYSFEWAHGDDRVPAMLGRDGAIVDEGWAKEHRLGVGDSFTLTSAKGTDLRLVVRGIESSPVLDVMALGPVTISRAAYDGAFENDRNAYLFAKGGDPARALAAFPDTKVRTRDAYVEEQLQMVDQLLAVFYVLLALAVIVSLFGIVNTLVLATFERTRELGTLRAVGMTPRQVRRMVRHESVITALIGATLGMAAGLGLAAVVTSQLADEGLSFAIPAGSLAGFTVVAILAGVLAAVLPARRAARTNVLAALAYE